MKHKTCLTERLMDVIDHPNRVSNCADTAFYLAGLINQDIELSLAHAKLRLTFMLPSGIPVQDGLVAWFRPRKNPIEFPEDSVLPSIGRYNLEHIGLISCVDEPKVHHRTRYVGGFIPNQPLKEIEYPDSKVVFYKKPLFSQFI